MIRFMKRRKRIASIVLGSVLALPGISHGATAEEVDNPHDARTEGYQNSVQIDGSTALTWIGFVFFSIICMSALFKDSKRARTE